MLCLWYFVVSTIFAWHFPLFFLSALWNRFFCMIFQCVQMYNDLYGMVGDYMEGYSVNQICKVARLCRTQLTQFQKSPPWGTEHNCRQNFIVFADYLLDFACSLFRINVDTCCFFISFVFILIVLYLFSSWERLSQQAPTMKQEQTKAENEISARMKSNSWSQAH